MEKHIGIIACAINRRNLIKYGCVLQLFLFILLLGSCSREVKVVREAGTLPAIYPDYIDVTIPLNIAPLNFKIQGVVKDAFLIIAYENYQIKVKGKNNKFYIPVNKWKKILSLATGKEIILTVIYKEQDEWIKYNPFPIKVSSAAIDPYLAYRLIEPGYTVWEQMGIYQRNLENFRQTPLMENKMTENNCMNCHSFASQDPETMMFHMRDPLPCTILKKDGKIEKLNTKTESTISSLVYPSWHPSGNYIAFSVNNTHQGFHMNDPNRIEVFDVASDVVIYDVRRHEIVTTPFLSAEDAFESFPTFSPDGKILYFCSSDTFSLPKEYDKVKYNLCSVVFDPDRRTFGGEVDTLYSMSREGESVSFPRISPDGKYLLYTKGAYGGFFIWHQEADLWMLNLETGAHYALEEANSECADSYHSWSSNSRWVVFSSRRDDGLYTRPYITYIDETGKASKAFVLPQKDPDFYGIFMKSYNVPELIKGKVKINNYSVARMIKESAGIQVKAVSPD